jgi:hypothetical protein
LSIEITKYGFYMLNLTLDRIISSI